MLRRSPEKIFSHLIARHLREPHSTFFLRFFSDAAKAVDAGFAEVVCHCYRAQLLFR
ncbi:hypothetical protein C7449_1123 [Mycoplana dimorpha]|uniref:Uncharacterized protein n=1 Tax=Mycoplana dimorpha TaxID=28320 RepID=A0A2T5ANT7_MYCDI|nr:hypothetical protein C7449_1123 [Mycoplana dimorpha]